MADYLVTDTELTNVANAIRNITNKTDNLTFPNGFIDALNSAPNEDADVLFVDYDGTELYGYSKSDFLTLTAMPANPSHTGLTAQGWNWSLADAKEYVTAYDRLCIGQNYTTSDGKTRIYITTDEEYTLSLYWRQTAANSIVIDWGDGSSTETSSSTDQANLSHTYSTPGNYIVTMETSSGSLSLGGGSSEKTLFGNSQKDRWNTFPIKKIEIGNVYRLSTYAFFWCMGVETISVPSTINTAAQFWGATFQSCMNLKCVVIPEGQTGANASNPSGECRKLKYYVTPKAYTRLPYCYDNNSLKRFHIAQGITSIGSSNFEACYSLKYITIPNSVTEVKSYAFQACYSIRPTTIPSSCVTFGTNAFASAYAITESFNVPSGTTALNSAFVGVRGLKTITIPNTVTSIGSSKSFQHCRSLQYIALPSSITALHDYDFQHCRSLRFAIIRGNVTQIPTSCFADCGCLTDIVLPSTVTSLGGNAFLNTYSLKNFIILSTTPPTVVSTTFSNSGIASGNGQIYVPYGYGNTYKNNTNWSAYASQISELPEGWSMPS